MRMIAFSLFAWSTCLYCAAEQKPQNSSGWAHTSDMSPDGSVVVTANCQSNQVWHVEVKTNKIKMLDGHSDWIWHISYCQSGKYFATCSNDKTIRVWDATNLVVDHVLKVDKVPMKVSINFDCTHVAVALIDLDNNKTVYKIFNIKNKEQVWEKTVDDVKHQFISFVDKSQLVYANEIGSVCIADFSTNKTTGYLSRDVDIVCYSATANGTIRLLYADGIQVVHIIKDNSTRVLSDVLLANIRMAQFSSDGETIVWSAKNKVGIYSVKLKKTIAEFSTDDNFELHSLQVDSARKYLIALDLPDKYKIYLNK